MGTQWAPPEGGEDLARFAQEHGPGLLRFAFLLTGGRTAPAQDVVQTVLTRLVERGIADLANPVAYARRAIVNEHHSVGRRGVAERRGLLRLVRGTGGVDGPGAPSAALLEEVTDRSPDHATGTLTRLDLLAALRLLPERDRTVIVLRYFLDLPDAEIGELVGCRRATVRSIVHRSLPVLRGHLGADYRAPDSPDDDLTDPDHDHDHDGDHR